MPGITAASSTTKSSDNPMPGLTMVAAGIWTVLPLTASAKQWAVAAELYFAALRVYV